MGGHQTRENFFWLSPDTVQKFVENNITNVDRTGGGHEGEQRERKEGKEEWVGRESGLQLQGRVGDSNRRQKKKDMTEIRTHNLPTAIVQL